MSWYHTVCSSAQADGRPDSSYADTYSGTSIRMQTVSANISLTLTLKDGHGRSAFKESREAIASRAVARLVFPDRAVDQMWTEHLQAGFTEPFQNRVDDHLEAFLACLSSYQEYLNVHDAWLFRNNLMVGLQVKLMTQAIQQKAQGLGLTDEEWRMELGTRAILAIVTELKQAERESRWTLEDQSLFDALTPKRGLSKVNGWDTLFLRQHIRLLKITSSPLEGTQILGMSLETLDI